MFAKFDSVTRGLIAFFFVLSFVVSLPVYVSGFLSEPVKSWSYAFSHCSKEPYASLDQSSSQYGRDWSQRTIDRYASESCVNLKNVSR